MEQTRISLTKTGEIEVARNANRQRVPFFAKQINFQPLIFTHREVHIVLGQIRVLPGRFYANFCFTVNDREIFRGVVGTFDHELAVTIDGSFLTKISVTFLKAAKRVVAKISIAEALHSQIVMVKNIFLYDAAAIEGNGLLQEAPAYLDSRLHGLDELVPKTRPLKESLAIIWPNCDIELDESLLVADNASDVSDVDLLFVNPEIQWPISWFSMFIRMHQRTDISCITNRREVATIDLSNGLEIDSSFRRILNPLTWRLPALPSEFSFLYLKKELRYMTSSQLDAFEDLPILSKAFMSGREIGYIDAPKIEDVMSPRKREQLELKWEKEWGAWTESSIQREGLASELTPQYPHKISLITISARAANTYKTIEENPPIEFAYEWIVTAAAGLFENPAFPIKYLKTRDLDSTAEAYNLAIQHATGDFVVFLDENVRLTPGCLDRMILALISDADLSGVHPTIYSNSEHNAGIVFSKDINGNYLPAFQSHTGLDRTYPAATAAILALRADKVLEARGFDIAYSSMGDVDLCLRIGGKYLCLADSSAFFEGNMAIGDGRDRIRYAKEHKIQDTSRIYLSANIVDSTPVDSTSVIIPSTSRRHLTRCLNSVEPTLSPQDQILVVTHSRAVQSEALSRKHQCLFIEQEYSTSRFCRIGAEASRADVLIFLHEGIEIKSKNWIAPLKEELSKPGAGAVSPTLIDTNGKVYFQGLHLDSQNVSYLRKGKEPISYPKTVSTAAIDSSCFAIKRSVFLQSNKFDEGFADIELSLKLASKGYSLKVLTETYLTQQEVPAKSTKPLTEEWQSFINRVYRKKAIRIWTIKIDQQESSRIAVYLAMTLHDIGHDVEIICCDVDLPSKAQLSMLGVAYQTAKDAKSVTRSVDINIVLNGPFLDQLDEMPGKIIVYNIEHMPEDVDYETRKLAEDAKRQALEGHNICYPSVALSRKWGSGPVICPGLDHLGSSTSGHNWMNTCLRLIETAEK